MPTTTTPAWLNELATIAKTNTPLPKSTVGIPANCIPVPRHDLDGSRLTPPSKDRIFVVYYGLLHYIPNPTTYNNLFKTWDGIVTTTDIPNIARGQDISVGAVLARGADTAPVYLVTGGQKLWITTSEIFNAFQFNWDAILVIPEILIDSIPTGPNIDHAG
jgi:hypothetical protein